MEIITLEEARRFSMLRSIPHVEVQYSHTKNSQEIELKLSGVLLGSMVRIFKRGKEINVLYFLTDAGSAYCRSQS